MGDIAVKEVNIMLRVVGAHGYFALLHTNNGGGSIISRILKRVSLNWSCQQWRSLALQLAEVCLSSHTFRVDTISYI